MVFWWYFPFGWEKGQHGSTFLVLARNQTKQFDETPSFGIQNLFILVSKDEGVFFWGIITSYSSRPASALVSPRRIFPLLRRVGLAPSEPQTYGRCQCSGCDQVKGTSRYSRYLVLAAALRELLDTALSEIWCVAAALKPMVHHHFLHWMAIFRISWYTPISRHTHMLRSLRKSLTYLPVLAVFFCILKSCMAQSRTSKRPPQPKKVQLSGAWPIAGASLKSHWNEAIPELHSCGFDGKIVYNGNSWVYCWETLRSWG